MADTIIQRFAADDSIGLVFPDDPNIIGWGENFLMLSDLASDSESLSRCRRQL